jgi:hypothetical protein
MRKQRLVALMLSCLFLSLLIGVVGFFSTPVGDLIHTSTGTCGLLMGFFAGAAFGVGWAVECVLGNIKDAEPVPDAPYAEAVTK